jgi:acyl-CoA reductase-like NAD-dependent aldehyde dehydrogenase
MSTPFWVAGQPVSRGGSVEISNPFDGSIVGAHHMPDAADVDDAITAAAEAHPDLSRIPARVRADGLARVSDAIKSRREEFANNPSKDH